MRNALLVAFLAMATFAASAQTQATDPFAAYHGELTAAADALLQTPMVAAPPSPEMAKTGEAPRTPVNRRLELQRVAQLRPTVEPILRETGIPSWLAAVMLVESAGRTDALSPAGARGPWQLMPATARRYGLVVDGRRDERTDPVKSTRAAAAYLRDLFAQFGDWQLAFAAYNAGEQAVAGALARSGAVDFTAVRSHLPRETQNYVPAVWNATRLFGSGLPLVELRSPQTHVVFAEPVAARFQEKQ